MKKYQVVGIGNAIVDVICQSNDLFLDQMGIEKGIMQLIERDRAELLYGAMDQRTEAPGGAVANTLAGLGALGVRTAFIGRVSDDSLGRFYANSMQETGTDFVNPPVSGGELPTSRSMIFVSEDGERSMNTYLGISAELGTEDVSLKVAAEAEIVALTLLQAFRMQLVIGGKSRQHQRLYPLQPTPHHPRNHQAQPGFHTAGIHAA